MSVCRRAGYALLALAALAGAAAADEGAAIYERICTPCHQAKGEGVAGVYPPLSEVGRFATIPEGRRYLARVVAFGMFGRIEVAGRTYRGLMPAQPQLSDAEIAAVLTHVVEEIAGGGEGFSAEEVAAARKEPGSLGEVKRERELALERLSEKATGIADEDMPRYAGAAEDFSRNCQGCHRGDGMGAPPVIPRLSKFVGYFTHLPEGREFLVRVPGVALARLDDARLTAVVNFMLETYAKDDLPPDFRPYTVEEVARLRRRPLTAIEETRARLVAELHARGIAPPEDDGRVPLAALASE